MTAPDVAAQLANALATMDWHIVSETTGEAITVEQVAAVAGWRITSAPEHRPGYCDRCGHAVDFHVPPGHQCSECSADDPVSAQAAPRATARHGGEHECSACDEYQHHATRFCSGCVRAALDGLRAEVMDEPMGALLITRAGIYIDRDAVLAIINARLEALDA